MPKPAFSRVALIGKHTPEIAGSLRSLREFLRQRGCEVRIERETAARIGDGGDAADFDGLGAFADLALVLGGDGTMLAAARSLARHKVPLAGINQGRVGFMTDIALQDMRASVGAILDGRFSLEERALRADGLIVATPTGSTAYALSAQGPILQPGVDAFALVPLNPHVLSARPVSVSDASVIEIALLRAVDARAHFDGYALTELAQGDRLVLRRSADAIRFVHPPGYSYFAMLREKLSWGEAAASKPED